MATFLHEFVENSEILCKPSGVLQESGALIVRIKAGRTRFPFQIVGTEALALCAAEMVPTPVINHPPALTRRRSLSKEGSLCPESRGELLPAKMGMKATMLMKTQGLRGDSENLPKIVYY
jgi:hypothetical protein